jgi:hypothetical protein
MILEPQEGKVCRNSHRVLAFLVICLNPSLAFLGARKFMFIKNYRNICCPGAGQTQSNDVNSNSSIIVLRLLRDRGNAGRNILEGPGKEPPIRPVFSQPDPFITDGPGAAGVITSTVIPQSQIQFALKLEF